jgi:hypothetical protein
MGLKFKGDNIIFLGVVYENEIIKVRHFLNEMAPNKIICNFQNCEDIHLAVLQQIFAYSLLYKIEYTYGSIDRSYHKIIKGFNKLENSCN